MTVAVIVFSNITGMGSLSRCTLSAPSSVSDRSKQRIAPSPESVRRGPRGRRIQQPLRTALLETLQTVTRAGHAKAALNCGC